MVTNAECDSAVEFTFPERAALEYCRLLVRVRDYLTELQRDPSEACAEDVEQLCEDIRQSLWAWSKPSTPGGDGVEPD